MIKKYSVHLPFFISMSFTGLLLVFRIFYSGSITYLFLVWNLFLAWIPLVISLYVAKFYQSKYLQGVLLTSWLLFFPNSLYIITDLVHLRERENVPLWFDSILLFSAVLNGMMMAYASLNKIENYLRLKFPHWKCNVILFMCISMSSFGIYIGRFLRFNSWDIFTNPVHLSTEVIQRFMFPFDHPATWGVTIILTIFFNVLYFSIKTIPGLLVKLNK
jgi:uncharacterized membrane protein